MGKLPEIEVPDGRLQNREPACRSPSRLARGMVDKLTCLIDELGQSKPGTLSLVINLVYYSAKHKI